MSKELIRFMIGSGKITTKTGQKVIEMLGEKSRPPGEIVEKMDLIKINGNDVIEKAVEEALSENKKAVDDYLSGNEKALNFVVGQVMRKTKQGDPSIVLKMLKDRL